MQMQNNAKLFSKVVVPIDSHSRDIQEVLLIHILFNIGISKHLRFYYGHKILFHCGLSLVLEVRMVARFQPPCEQQGV